MRSPRLIAWVTVVCNATRWLRKPGVKPPPQRDKRPNSLDQTKRPRALEEAIRRPECAGSGECKNIPVAAIFQRVADKHRGNGEQAEGSGSVHHLPKAASTQEVDDFAFEMPPDCSGREHGCREAKRQQGRPGELLPGSNALEYDPRPTAQHRQQRNAQGPRGEFGKPADD